MSGNKLVFVGTLVSSVSMKELCIGNCFLCVEDGKITKKGTIEEFKQLKNSGAFDNYTVKELGVDQFLMPGFVDCHTHAPQYPNLGLGLDRPLLEWLAMYTFPLEKKYSDLEFARQVYDKVVQRLLTNGTTTACYFGTLHKEGSLQLAASVVNHHQRALVGKVSMNLPNDEGYFNSTEKELADTEEFVKNVINLKNKLVQPVVTPRFAVSCDRKLMSGLANIAAKYNCFTQSHISENLKEIEYVLEINRDCKSYGEVYEQSQILNDKCIMAHAVHLRDDELALLSKRGVTVAHCPASNTRLKSGLCPVLKLIQNNIVVGLGTDVSGGDNATILDAMRRAIDVSTLINGGAGDNISWSEAFYLATLGGAEALRLSHKIGSLEINKEFDALLVDVYPKGGPVTKFEGFPTFAPGSKEYLESLVQRFIYVGDDRNIIQVYVNGKNVKDLNL